MRTTWHSQIGRGNRRSDWLLKSDTSQFPEMGRGKVRSIACPLPEARVSDATSRDNVCIVVAVADKWP
jgi:hypothetical protein